MRPIELKVKGLNSFIEEQKVDFNKLTERGFFGIFGPTGSGKSTILDGITLALYGQVSRKSSNYINTNCNSLNVSFEFQISGTEKRTYIVSREFKRDNKTGNPRTSRAKIIDKTNEIEEVLADKAQRVTEKCEEIIGLGLEDFTRTVVLPQGKFSEFLKLEGKSRREMLERLFNLQKYGNILSVKLSKEINKEKTESNLLTGELKGYEEVSNEKLDSKNKEFEFAKKQLNSAITELNNIEKKYKLSEEIWNLQLELNSYKEQKKVLNYKSNEIEEDKIKFKLGEAALKVKPYLLAYENTLKENDKTKIEKEKLEINFKELKIEKEDAERKLLDITEKKDKEIPELKLREQKINDVIEEKSKLDILDKEIEEVALKVQVLREKYKKENNKFGIIDGNIKNTDINIKELEKQFESLKIDDELKSKVQEGLLISEKYNLFERNIINNKNKCANLNKEIEGLKLEFSGLQKIYKVKIDSLNKNKEELEELIKHSPGKQEDLLSLHKILTTCNEKWEKFNRYSEEIKKSKLLIEELEELLKKDKDKKTSLDNELLELKEKYKKYEIENLAFKIRMNLRNGEACPVCGSLEHRLEDKDILIDDLEDDKINELNDKISRNENKLKKLEQEITVYNTRITSEKEKIKEKKIQLENLGEEFKKLSPKDIEQQFNKLKKDIEDYEIKKEGLENTLIKLNDENHKLENNINKISTVVVEKENQLDLINEELNLNINEFNDVKEKLQVIKEETKVSDFNKKSEEIINIEKDRDNLSKKIKELRINIETLIKEKDIVQDNLKLITEEGTDARTSLNEKNKNREEKIKIIKDKLEKEFNLLDDSDNIDKDKLFNLLDFIKKDINSIEVEFKLIHEEKDKTCVKYEKCNEEFISIVTKQNELIKRCEIEKEKLNKSLKDENFESIEDAKKNIIESKDIERLKEKIEKYKEDLSKINGAIESSVKKLNNREITEEQWINIQNGAKEKKTEVETLNETKIKLEEEHKFIDNKLKELKDLMVKREKIDHKLALLDDLDKLFKGKKFVEFVAITQLKYISMEASKKLKEITNGNYGLEVDENGKFIIRDYKNGGAERDASTLSGGETFLTSLALALALSSQIQLKGTAPLELFFLDEGFGTLDDNLLEVVMSSLERLHNDKLKIGIISHVESIKNRVPVKLILTPAESGKGGSKVRLERS
ncbi:SbcC/MukB-like Walker B domain-containing protein [uncultured Clostridium sp.]|uniref:SbcC/MukB-like Walker B domain-containing protein n=1 Tax=uncultured Clostridium sp. TaxID=59620 RepID=UPI0028EC0FEA|nr:SbcC/MukB-like Walker B domain-containing protein [uncultured Clostridium sp.]